MATSPLRGDAADASGESARVHKPATASADKTAEEGKRNVMEHTSMCVDGVTI
ncbi:MAG: hypothetical protein ABW205_00685 [Burkholderiales bacterium]